MHFPLERGQHHQQQKKPRVVNPDQSTIWPGGIGDDWLPKGLSSPSLAKGGDIGFEGESWMSLEFKMVKYLPKRTEKNMCLSHQSEFI